MKIISKEQKVGYWTIITNIVLVLTTVWLGLAVQDFVAEKNANVSAVLAKVEYVNSVKPSVDSLNVQYNAFLCDIDSTLNYWNNSNDNKTAMIGMTISYLFNVNEMFQYFGDLINTSKEVVYYLDDATVDSNIKGNMITKIGLLYSYRELFGFYFMKDTIHSDSVRTEKDWPILNNQLRNLYRSPEYVSTMGLNIHYDKLQKEFVSKYQKLFQSDGITPDVNAIFYLIDESFTLALDIHKTLNDNRTYRQNEISILEKLIKAPWSILLISILLMWIVLTFIVFRTGDPSSNNIDDQRLIRIMDYKLDNVKKETQSKLDLIESNLHQTNVVLNDSIDYLEKTLDDLTEKVDGINNNNTSK